tara:strand:- start:140 stop:310 length:171 start_codon:yes stop_codon:yes gene_type:complete
LDKLKRFKRTRSNNTLFNPYKNGISTYDLAFLSSKKVSKNKSNFFKKEFIKEYFAA